MPAPVITKIEFESVPELARRLYEALTAGERDTLIAAWITLEEQTRRDRLPQR